MRQIMLNAHAVQRDLPRNTPAVVQRDPPPDSWPVDEVTEVDRVAGWRIDDAVVRLRRWGTDDIYLLPQTGEVTVGASDVCGIEVSDAAGHRRISRLHARLTCDAGMWRVRDLGSRNGVMVDGAVVTEAALVPGSELRVGGITLVAESDRLIQLRAYLLRILGRKDPAAMELALRSIRMAATGRVAIVLRGAGDLVPIARAIHCRTLGADRPFIVCDPRRHEGRATVRSAENYETGMPALAAAAGGSLCVRSLRLPRDFHQVMAALREPGAGAVLAVCSTLEHHDETRLDAPVTVPDLAGRDDIDQVIDEYAEDALALLGARRETFTSIDHDWVLKHSAGSLSDIEKATVRLTAINSSRNITTAAARLGMAPVSLARWIGRRRLPRQRVARGS